MNETSETAATSGEDHDVPLGEPVLGLAAFEDRLERAEPGHEQPDARASRWTRRCAHGRVP